MNKLLELIDKVRATNSSQPLVHIYSQNGKESVEKMFDIKLDSDDEIKLGIRFVKMEDFKCIGKRDYILILNQPTS